MRHWSPSAEQTLRTMYATASLAKLAFRLKRTEKAIRSRAKMLGLSRGTRRPWTATDDRVLRRRFPKETAAAIAGDLGRGVSCVYQRAHKLGLTKADGWASECTRKRWAEGRHENSRMHQFRKGQVPPNKGLRRPGWAPGRMRATMFKPGQRPKTWVPIGTEVVDRDGYRKRKVRDDAPSGQSRFNWVYCHVALWEEHLGPVPPKHCVVFKNRDKTDIRIDNLACISLRANMRRNTLHNYPKSIVRLIQMRGALNRQINRSKTRE